MSNRAAKGTKFERWFSEELSKWWTHGERTDVFWRTSNSGGRATTRGKAKKRTSGQYGDITAIDPIGLPLLKFFTIELKRGYNQATIADMLDKPKRGKAQVYEEWFKKAEENRKAAGSCSWMLIHKRDRREPLMFTHNSQFRLTTEEILFSRGGFSVSAIRLSSFFLFISPEDIKEKVK